LSPLRNRPMTTRALFLLIACLLFCPGADAADNPFLTAPKKEEQKVTPQRSFYPAIMQKAFSTLSQAQRRLHEKISGFARQLKKDPSIKIIVLLFAVAFLYGVIHALGPGHGKAFAVSYFISEKADVKKGAILGNLIAFIHVGTSVVLVLIIYSVVRSTVLNHVEDTTRTISLISYALITLIGLTLLFLRIKNKTHHSPHDYSHGEGLSTGSNKSIISVALAAGIVPCPGTIMLLIFSMSLGMLLLGILLALAIAAGMAVTISLAGIAAILSRRLLLDVILKTQNMRLILANGMEFAGCIAIVLLGGALFISSL